MSATIIIMTLVLLLTLCAPFGVKYAVHLARIKDYPHHRKAQNIIFVVCILGVLLLEGLIQSSGGSGSLASQSKYYQTAFFKVTLISYIFVAVISYILWTLLIVISNVKFRKTLPGKFSALHKKMGYMIFGGLIYTAITALMVYIMSLNLI